MTPGLDQCENCDGWCEFHHLHKSPGGVALCQNDEAQRHYWYETAEQRRAQGIGTKLASLLQSMGITKERYALVKQLFGLPPDCDCDARKEWLNKVQQFVKTGRV